MSKLRFSFILILFLCGFYSCSKNGGTIPEGVIPKDTMISVMADIHLAESRLMMSGKYAQNTNLKSTYMQEVLHRSNIDTSRLQKSFSYYSSQPELFSEMYDKVMEEISKRQATAKGDGKK